MSRFSAWLNRPQKKWSGGNSRADASIERAISASASPPISPCQWAASQTSTATHAVRSLPVSAVAAVRGQAGDRVLHGRPIAAEDPEDQGFLACPGPGEGELGVGLVVRKLGAP